MPSSSKHVLAYLRKSRGDNEDALSKHKDMLLELCSRENYTPKFYQEIESGEKIAYRPEFQKLLDELKTGKYYAVIAVETERLSRGDILTNPDIVTIYSRLIETNTILHTVRDGVLDPAKDNLFLSVKALLSHNEYRTIKERLRNGKKMGAKQGYWTNGKPPYPYIYDRVNQQVLVDEGLLPNYRFIIESYLRDKSIKDITLSLNARGIPSPNGTIWNTHTVNRILRDKFHLGLIVTNKSVGDGHKHKGGRNIALPESEWNITEGQHQAVKTQEEHEAVLAKLALNNRIPNAAKKGVYPLSGLLYCAKCGYRMVFRSRKRKRTKDIAVSALCVHMDWTTGERCSQVGCTITKEFLDALLVVLEETTAEELSKLSATSKQESSFVAEMKQLENEKIKQEKALERIQMQFEEGLIDKEMWLKRNKDRKEKIESILKAIEEIKLVQKTEVSAIPPEELARWLTMLKEKWSIFPAKGINDILKKVVKRITYDRNGEEITLQVEFF
ncbi:MAG: recombinase family protein [Peptococcales bacterium]|jgi:site-specific DNA recombinase